MTRRSVFGVLGALSSGAMKTAAQSGRGTASGNPSSGAANSRALDRFMLSNARNILEEDSFGIANGRITVGINYGHLVSISGLFAPPYASSDFRLELRLFGERIPTQNYIWYPAEVTSRGTLYSISVTSSVVLVPDTRGGMIEIALQNNRGERVEIPLQLDVTGSANYVEEWGFARPVTRGAKTVSEFASNQITFRAARAAFTVGSDLPTPRWEEWSSHLEAVITLQPGERRIHHFSFAIGERQESKKASEILLTNSTHTIATARQQSADAATALFGKVPSIEASDKRLTAYYNRTLVIMMLNRWTVPEFVLNPFYSTGSVRGGCLACYLWDYGCVPELLPLIDPDAVRAHIKHFLQLDMTKHFLFNPLDGVAAGPWYPVNQEKLILSIYHYVLHTGDVAFLNEPVNGKTILDWAIYQAVFGDHEEKSAVLLDYGNGNNHLELRGKYRYDNILPDLNGRRYKSFQLVAELGELAGQSLDYLNARCGPLKALLRERLWDARSKWFYFEFANGTRELRYTIQMYKMIGSGVLDRDQEEGLISHLNDDEFLSPYGIHSISKKDPAYDQVDIDAGGGGNYCAFTPRIAELLYGAGYPKQAADLIRRTLWWGDRVPYWGDSFVANQVDYRKDTPLQSDIAAGAGAQCIIFGMFGVKVLPSGNIVVNPHPPDWSPEISLHGLRLRGVSMDITVRGSEFEVKTGREVRRSRLSNAVLIPT